MINNKDGWKNIMKEELPENCKIISKEISIEQKKDKKEEEKFKEDKTMYDSTASICACISSF